MRSSWTSSTSCSIADQRGFGGEPPRPDASTQLGDQRARPHAGRVRVRPHGGSVADLLVRAHDARGRVPAGRRRVVGLGVADASPARRAHADHRGDARRRTRTRRTGGDPHRVRELHLRPLRLRRRGLAARRCRRAVPDRVRRARTTTTGVSVSSPATRPRSCCRRCTSGRAPTRAGMVTRPDFWWPQVFWEFMFERGEGGLRGGPRRRGRAATTATSSTRSAASGRRGLPDRRLSIIDMQAESPATWIHLWRYVFGVDLIGTVAASNLPIDDPLRHIVVDSRRVRVDYINDHLWLAPLDPLAVFACAHLHRSGTSCHRGPRARRSAVDDRGRSGIRRRELRHHHGGTRLRLRIERCSVCARSAGTAGASSPTRAALDVRRPDVLALADAMFLATRRPRCSRISEPRARASPALKFGLLAPRSGPARTRARDHAEGAARPAEAVHHQLVDLGAGRDALVDDALRLARHREVHAGSRRTPTASGCPSRRPGACRTALPRR